MNVDFDLIEVVNFNGDDKNGDRFQESAVGLV